MKLWLTKCFIPKYLKIYIYFYDFSDMCFTININIQSNTFLQLNSSSGMVISFFYESSTVSLTTLHKYSFFFNLHIYINNHHNHIAYFSLRLSTSVCKKSTLFNFSISKVHQNLSTQVGARSKSKWQHYDNWPSFMWLHEK